MRRFALAVGIAALAACSVGLSGCTHHAPSAQDQGAPAFITLQNVLPNNYQLYISDGTRRLDAGKVDALQTVTIKVPSRLVYPGARLAVIAVPTVSARTLAVPFTVHPGATISVDARPLGRVPGVAADSIRRGGSVRTGVRAAGSDMSVTFS